MTGGLVSIEHIISAVPYDNCIGVPSLHLLTVGSMSVYNSVLNLRQVLFEALVLARGEQLPRVRAADEGPHRAAVARQRVCRAPAPADVPGHDSVVGAGGVEPPAGPLPHQALHTAAVALVTTADNEHSRSFKVPGEGLF